MPAAPTSAPRMRYAIYYAPAAGSPLDDLGSHWLGRDAVIGTPLAQPIVPGLGTTQVAMLTGAPRHYGLHATLKAPFRLRADCTADELADSLRDFAAQQSAFAIELGLRELDESLALRPTAGEAALSALGWQCVQHFDRFRAPLAEQEFERRAAGLSERQRVLLRDWGYPYVDEQYRFHITLCARMNATEASLLRPFLKRYFAPVCGVPIAVDSLCLFEEQGGAPMRLKARYAIGVL